MVFRLQVGFMIEWDIEDKECPGLTIGIPFITLYFGFGKHAEGISIFEY